MNFETTLLQKLVELQTKHLHESVTRSSDHDNAYAYGVLVGTHRGLEMAKVTLLGLLADQKHKDFDL